MPAGFSTSPRGVSTMSPTPWKVLTSSRRKWKTPFSGCEWKWMWLSDRNCLPNRVFFFCSRNNLFELVWTQFPADYFMLWLICCSSQFLLLWLCLEFVCFPSYDLTSWQVRCTVYFPLPRLVWKSKCPLNQNLSTQKACESCRLPVVPKSHEGLKSRGVFFSALCHITAENVFDVLCFCFVFPPSAAPSLIRTLHKSWDTSKRRKWNLTNWSKAVRCKSTSCSRTSKIKDILSAVFHALPCK